MSRRKSTPSPPSNPPSVPTSNNPPQAPHHPPYPPYPYQNPFLHQGSGHSPMSQPLPPGQMPPHSYGMGMPPPGMSSQHPQMPYMQYPQSTQHPAFQLPPYGMVPHMPPPPASTTRATSSGPSASSSPRTAEPVDPEDAAVLEDKRQRNTAASARFRIKKKQKTLELERTVSDLTSRATELEREAANLRRENTWLKEIVIMKGRQNISNNQGESSGRNESKSSRRGKEETSEESSDANSSDGEKASKKSKGKGKAKK